MENTAVISCAPRSVNVTVRKPSSRPREYLTEREVEKLIDTAGKNRWGHRDATAILVAYRHGLRASEVVSLRWAPLSVAGYQRMVARAGESAGFPFLVHSHMLRHSCGYKLANDGQDTRAIQHYLGHKSINSTVRYTALAPDRFKGFWKD
jgi:type 1 fimbriae regulatory protein FimB/type 1 fimbriae regulatory protein FimE